jgi:serine/threonine protein kinase
MLSPQAGRTKVSKQYFGLRDDRVLEIFQAISAATPMALALGSTGLWKRRKGTSDINRPTCDVALVKADVAAANERCSDLVHSIDTDYDVREILGHGSLGVVHRAVRRRDGEIVALKATRTSDEDKVAIVKAEFTLLKRLDHPHIVQALDFFVTSDLVVLVLSLCVGDQLGIAVRRTKEKRLSEGVARKSFAALLQALDYLHQRRILHRDIKPENVMVSEDFAVLKLIDFNIARLSDGGSLSPNTSLSAPEVRIGCSPSEVTDIWGAGVCLCFMLSGQCPRVDMQSNTVSFNSTHMTRVSEPCTSILRQCLAMDHKMRPAAMTLLQAGWAQDGIGEGGVVDSSRPSRKRSESLSPHSPSRTARGKATALKRSSSCCPMVSILRSMATAPPREDGELRCVAEATALTNVATELSKMAQKLCEKRDRGASMWSVSTHASSIDPGGSICFDERDLEALEADEMTESLEMDCLLEDNIAMRCKLPNDAKWSPSSSITVSGRFRFSKLRESSPIVTTNSVEEAVLQD